MNIITTCNISPFLDKQNQGILINQYNLIYNLYNCQFKYQANFYIYFLFKKKSVANNFKKELIEAQLSNNKLYSGVSRKLNLVTLNCYLFEQVTLDNDINQQNLENLKIKIKSKIDNLNIIFKKYQDHIETTIFKQD